MKLALLVPRYAKLLALRLANVAERFREEVPELCDRTGFTRAWESFESSQPSTFDPVEPSLDLWVSKAERIVQRNLHRNYPESQPSRLLEDFSTVRLRCANRAQDAGELDSYGRLAISLPGRHGPARTLLVRDEPWTGPRIRWKASRQTLGLYAGDDVLAEVGSEECTCAFGWRQHDLPMIEGLVVDSWSPELLDGRSCPELEPACAEALLAEMHALTKPARAIVQATLSVIVPELPGAAWAAGVGRGAVLRAASADLVRRTIAVARFFHSGQLAASSDDLSELLERFVGMASTRIAASLEGRPQPADPSWVELAKEIAGQPWASAVYAGLEAFLGPSPTCVRSAQNPLALHKIAVLDGLLDDGLWLHKTRCSDVHVPHDWGALRVLNQLDHETLARIAHTLAASDDLSEAENYVLAMCAYLAGFYEIAEPALRTCNKLDPDVLEYRHLYAFTLRHQGQIDEFERLVFGRAGQRPLELPKPTAKSPHRKSNWRGFLGELASLRGEIQLPQYAAVLGGIRKAMDDLIPALLLGDFLALAKRLGLHVGLDCIFLPIDDPNAVSGISRSPTTRAAAVPLTAEGLLDPRGRVHVVIGGQPAWVDETLSACWYSVAVGGRVMVKPLVDHGRLGSAFGYPDCCVSFFMRKNDWNLYNTLVETFRASRELHWQANALMRSTPWSTLFHMPCAFDCEPTMTFTDNVLEVLRECDPAYSMRVVHAMQGVFLLVSEKLIYHLKAARRSASGRWTYERARNLFAGGTYQEAYFDYYDEVLSNSNELEVNRSTVCTWRDGRPAGAFEVRCDRGIVECPTLLDFRPA